jgi:hypothetical protein
MTSLVLDCERDDAKILIKAAFENTRGIKQYHDDGHRIIGKTGMGIGSYGENITVEIPEQQSSDSETMISVSADKEVSMNVTANPDKYKSWFLTEVERLRERDLEEVKDEMAENLTAENTKEVKDAGDLREGSSSVGLVMVVTMVVFALMMFMMFAAMMP